MKWYDKLVAAYPREFSANGSTQLWDESFRNHDQAKVHAAVSGWINDSRRAPTVADIRERLRINADHSGVRATQCGQCDNGWEWVDLTGVGTVIRCRNGCLPRVQGSYVPEDDDHVDPRKYTTVLLRDRPKPKPRRR